MFASRGGDTAASRSLGFPLNLGTGGVEGAAKTQLSQWRAGEEGGWVELPPLPKSSA